MWGEVFAVDGEHDEQNDERDRSGKCADEERGECRCRYAFDAEQRYEEALCQKEEEDGNGAQDGDGHGWVGEVVGDYSGSP